jgi:hydroxypyruvate reductase
MIVTRAAISSAFARALRELDPAARVEDAIPRAWSTGAAPVRVIAIGKAAPAMAAGAFRRLGDRIERCLVITSDGTDDRELHVATDRAHAAARANVLRAGHPLPDARSVRAGRACLAMMDDAAKRGRARTLVLVSGGASALACVPAPGITLRTKRAITRAMLASGASIQDINVVRKHLSLIKGGGLARHAAPGALLTLVASDVGSGPSVPDDSTVAAARRLLARHAPAFRDVPLVPTFSAATAPAKVVISPEELARTIASVLRADETRTVRVLPPSQVAVEALAGEYATLALRTRGARIYVRAAEPAVAVGRGRGRGGRSTHLAALVGQRLGEERVAAARAQSERILFAALASDGVDGSSGTGGAIIDAGFAKHAAARLGDAALARALDRFDTGPLHRALGTALPAHATGHNLADLHVLVVV